ncbi:MAG: hypothetical protein WCR74_22385 [Betaproteobacteria bacterium]
MNRPMRFVSPAIAVLLALAVPHGPGAIAQSTTSAPPSAAAAAPAAAASPDVAATPDAAAAPAAPAAAATPTTPTTPTAAATPDAAATPSANAGSTSKLSVKERDAERAERLAIRDNGLAMLYKAQPDAQKSVEAAAGYAVLDVTAVYIILFVGQSGKGVLVDNASKKVTYMSSKRVGTGPGAGKQRVFQVFVFKEKTSMDKFVLSGGVGGDVGVSVTMGSQAMVRSFNTNIDIYQIAESGFALQAGWGGTAYSVNKDLE